MTRPSFETDHALEPLRGRVIPKPSAVRRTMARRVAYLIRKHDEWRPTGSPIALLLEEIAAIAVLVEQHDRVHGAPDVTFTQLVEKFRARARTVSGGDDRG